MKKTLLLIASVVFLASCSNTLREETTARLAQKISVRIADFGDEADGTKSTVTPEGNFFWADGDALGVWPLTVAPGQVTTQCEFSIMDVEGSAASATFCGTGWGLITNGDYSYCAYYPFDSDSKKDEAVISYPSVMNQTGNNTTDHLGRYDYMYAPAITPATTEEAEFNFYHIGALVEFVITVPGEAKEKSFNSVSIRSASKIFTVKGNYNLSTTTSDSKPFIVATEKENTLALTLNGKIGITPDEDGKIHALFLMAPVKFSTLSDADRTLKIRLVSTDGTSYIGTKKIENDLESQNHKQYECSVEYANVDYDVDLNASGETANCYVVDAANTVYRFNANVKGNGYDPEDEINHNANAAIVGAATAEVIWETVNTATKPADGTIIKSVEYGNGYVYFTTADTFTAGNAEISVKNGDGTILWSWHIWATDADLETSAQTYGGGTIMDRNLGALSANPADGALTKGMMYQWGRPWPFRSSYSMDTSSLIATTHSTNWSSSSVLFTSVEESITCPMAYRCNGSFQWITTIIPLWGALKTMYDPCPIGWKVPSGGTDSPFRVFNATNTIWNGIGRYWNERPDVFIPVGGFLNSGSGTPARADTDGYLWLTDLVDSKAVMALTIKKSDVVFFIDKTFTCGYGFNVRACKE